MPEEYPFGVAELNNELGWEDEEALTEDDIKELKANPPKSPSFPIFVLLFALVKDFSDIISLGFLGIFVNIIGWFVIRIYLFGKVGFIKKLLYRKFIFTFILGFIPVVNMIPEWSVFVVRGYLGEMKKVNQVLETIESMIKKLT